MPCLFNVFCWVIRMRLRHGRGMDACCNNLPLRLQCWISVAVVDQYLLLVSCWYVQGRHVQRRMSAMSCGDVLYSWGSSWDHVSCYSLLRCWSVGWNNVSSRELLCCRRVSWNNVSSRELLCCRGVGCNSVFQW